MNAVGNHCHAGILVEAMRVDNQLDRYVVGACGPEQLTWTTGRSASNRCRNFRFSQPFIQSMAKIKLPGVAQTAQPPITLADHEAFMLRETHNFPIKQGLSQTYTSYVRVPQDAAVLLLEDLIMRDFTDVAYTREFAHRRRRAEWPSLDPSLLNRIRRDETFHSNTSVATQQACGEFIQNATKGCDFDAMYYEDEEALMRLSEPNPQQWYGDILTLMYYRGRMQSAVWDVFTILCERGMLDYRASLQEPMDWVKASKEDQAVLGVLECFDLVTKEQEQHPSPFRIWSPSYAPIEWLAIAIARGCSEPNLLFREIEATQMLGHLDTEKVERRSRGYPGVSWVCNPTAAAGQQSPYFAFWLPHGLGSNLDLYAEKIRESIKRFNQVEYWYKTWFQVPDDELQTEVEQDSFLRKNPQRQPGLKHSGHWTPELAPVSPPLSPSDPRLQNTFFQSLH